MQVKGVIDFLNGEKATQTDKVHKCFAKKYSSWLKDVKKKSKTARKNLQLTRAQHKAITNWDPARHCYHLYF